MATVISIAFRVLFIFTIVAFYLHVRRYRELRNYTFWVEQCLLHHRPETYIPDWRKRQRDKHICKRSFLSGKPGQTLVRAANLIDD